MTTTQIRETSLARQTLRTVAVLVGACVLFVGTLSITAVVIADKAIGGGHDRSAQQPTSTSKLPPQSI